MINRLLLACWLARQGIGLTPSRLLQLDSHWREDVTQPLRSVRYRVREWREQRSEMEPCYQALRQAELAAEQVELMLLWQQASRWLPGRDASAELLRHNLTQVLTARDGVVTDERLERLRPLESAAMALLEVD